MSLNLTEELNKMESCWDWLSSQQVNLINGFDQLFLALHCFPAGVSNISIRELFLILIAIILNLR